MYNVAIIGAGPAGIFSALEIIKLRPEWKVILIEKGQKIEKRKCPIRFAKMRKLQTLRSFMRLGRSRCIF